MSGRWSSSSSDYWWGSDWWGSGWGSGGWQSGGSGRGQSSGVSLQGKGKGKGSGVSLQGHQGSDSRGRNPQEVQATSDLLRVPFPFSIKQDFPDNMWAYLKGEAAERGLKVSIRTMRHGHHRDGIVKKSGQSNQLTIQTMHPGDSVPFSDALDLYKWIFDELQRVGLAMDPHDDPEEHPTKEQEEAERAEFGTRHVYMHGRVIEVAMAGSIPQAVGISKWEAQLDRTSIDSNVGPPLVFRRRPERVILRPGSTARSRSRDLRRERSRACSPSRRPDRRARATAQAQQDEPSAPRQAEPPAPAPQQARPAPAPQQAEPPTQRAEPPTPQQATPPTPQQAEPPAPQQAEPPAPQQAEPPTSQQAEPPSLQQAEPSPAKTDPDSEDIDFGDADREREDTDRAERAVQVGIAAEAVKAAVEHLQAADSNFTTKAEVAVRSMFESDELTAGASLKIVMCMATYKRTAQLELALPINMATAWSLRDKVVWVLADLNDEESAVLTRWLAHSVPSSLSAGQLHVFRRASVGGAGGVSPGGLVPFPGWHASVGKNTSHYVGIHVAGMYGWEPEDVVLVNCDADNLPTPKFFEILLAKHTSMTAPTCTDASGNAWPAVTGISFRHPEASSTTGRVAMSARVFMALRGYDESFGPMGGQDVDLSRRLQAVRGAAELICGAEEVGNVLNNVLKCVAKKKGGRRRCWQRCKTCHKSTAQQRGTA